MQHRIYDSNNAVISLFICLGSATHSTQSTERILCIANVLCEQCPRRCSMYNSLRVAFCFSSRFRLHIVNCLQTGLSQKWQQYNQVKQCSRWPHACSECYHLAKKALHAWNRSRHTKSSLVECALTATARGWNYILLMRRPFSLDADWVNLRMQKVRDRRASKRSFLVRMTMTL